MGTPARFSPVRPLLVFIAVLSIVSIAFADNGPNHKVAQTRPIRLGTSGGNIYDYSSRYCCSGTLGALVQDASGVQYILSNNHVLGRSNLAVAGEGVDQPGAVDQNCGKSGVVANFTMCIPLKFKAKRAVPSNLADAAIAEVIPGEVRTDGAILDIGTVSGNTLAASVNQSVQKSGRTTGQTFGKVTAIDVTVDVGYSTTCGGPSKQVAHFVNQIAVSPGTFSASGDSGSLIVEANTTDPANGRPRAVGLLFAGSSTSTIANPIANVLSQLGVTMVGGAASAGTPQAATVEAPGLAKAKAVKARHSGFLLAKSGVVGHGVGLSKDGKPAIVVYLESESPSVRAQIPKSFEDVPVEVIVTGPFEAF